MRFLIIKKISGHFVRTNSGLSLSRCMTIVLILRINQLVYQNQHHIMWRKLGCYEESKRKCWGVIPDKHQWCCMYPIDLDAAVDTKQILFGQILNLHDQQEPRYSRKSQQITSRKCL